MAEAKPGWDQATLPGKLSNQGLCQLQCGNPRTPRGAPSLVLIVRLSLAVELPRPLNRGSYDEA
jgi:hypothetical protein